MHYQRARIILNWKFLGTSKDIHRSNQSWDIVIQAALEIMRLQHLVAQESEVLDAFRPSGIGDSCFINNGYFLAASIACFLLQHRKNRSSAEDLSEVQNLLEKSLDIWSHTHDLSREARKVVTAMRVVLGKPEEPYIPTTQEAMASSQFYGGENLTHDREDRDLTHLSCAATDTNQTAFFSFATFFDDLPLVMNDIDTSTYPSLPSIPMIDYWPQVERGD